MYRLYLRPALLFSFIFSLSIAFYESVANHLLCRTTPDPVHSYLLTLPAEWRFYRSQRSWRLSPGCLLFIAIRSVPSLIHTPPPLS